MHATTILPGLIAAAVILSACSGKDDPDATATSTSKGSTATTGSTQGTTAAESSSTTSAETKTTSPSTSTSTAGPSGTTDSGCDTFECNPDQGTIEEWCDMFAQDCPEGQKCIPWASNGGSSWNSTRCSPIVPDPQQTGEACIVEGSATSGVDNCDKTSMCWEVDKETNEGVCAPLCQGDYEDPICAPGLTCNIDGEGILLLCLPDCDPMLQNCPGDDICIPSDESFICVLDESGEGGAYGDPCDAPNGCDPGLYCLSSEYVEDCKDAGCCTPWCDTSQANTCPGDTQECIPWYEEGIAPPGKENIGICALPQ